MDFAIWGRQVSLRLTLIFAVSIPAFAGWRMSGPFGGSARSLAIDPQNRNLLLAGARDSLLFRSDNAGASWRSLPFPATVPGVFNALLIHPEQGGHFYAGLDAGASRDSGVYESLDGGEHWQAQATIRGSRVESLAMWGRDPRVLAAGTSNGVFLTGDGGKNWRRISSASSTEMQDITALAFDPTDARTIYAGTPHLPWKTMDGGATWSSINTGLIDDSDIFSIHVDAKRPQSVFASACSGIYRSGNAGGAWTKLNGIPGTHRRTHIIAPDPGNSDTIFAGTTLGLFKSTDAGMTWRHNTSEQINWLVFDPSDARTLYLATEHAGIWKSSDSGVTFRPVNAGFANHSLTEITGAGNMIYASSADGGRYGGVFFSSDGGMNWSLRANEEALLGRHLNSLSASTAKPTLLFAASDDAVLKSIDAGKTWTRLMSQPGAIARQRTRIHSLQAVQSDKLRLYAGTQNGLFRSSNSGLSWEQVKAPGIAGVPVLATYAPPRGSTRLAVRTASELLISEDAGGAWHPATLPDSSYYIYDVALPIDRAAPILAATSRGVLQSVDGGAHWKLIINGLPAATVESVRFHPVRNLEAFLVQFGKIYRSLDGGSSWQPFPSDGLENSSVRRIWFAPELPARVFALSPARGALVFDLPQTIQAKQVDEVTSTKN